MEEKVREGRELEVKCRRIEVEGKGKGKRSMRFIFFSYLYLRMKDNMKRREETVIGKKIRGSIKEIRLKERIGANSKGQKYACFIFLSLRKKENEENRNGGENNRAKRHES